MIKKIVENSLLKDMNGYIIMSLLRIHIIANIVINNLQMNLLCDITI